MPDDISKVIAEYAKQIAVLEKENDALKHLADGYSLLAHGYQKREPTTVDIAITKIERFACRLEQLRKEKKTSGRYRKRPVIVEAAQTPVKCEIETLEGTMIADAGDWIIIGVKGERYPCKPDIFAATYEPVDEPSEAQLACTGVFPSGLQVLADLHNKGWLEDDGLELYLENHGLAECLWCKKGQIPLSERIFAKSKMRSVEDRDLGPGWLCPACNTEAAAKPEGHASADTQL